MNQGGGLVTVHAHSRIDEAEKILTHNHGQIDRDYSTGYGASSTTDTAVGMGQGTRADITGGDVGNPLASSGLNADELRKATPERRIQLISEVLRVRKDRVASGEVRLRKQVRTETQNIQVPVTREEIVIERSPVAGQRTPTGQIGSDQDIRVPLTEERVSVEKVPVVTEEVKVGKRTVSNTQNVTDQVRREELDVEGADQNFNKSDPKKKIA
jgi:uncharacterized protein (TIGR02271 family)